MQVEMKRYGHYPILVGDNASLLVPATLGELNSPGCPGRQYRTDTLHIATNGIDAAAKLHNANLNTTLPEEVHVSLKAYLSDATNSSLHDEVAQDLLYPPFNFLVPGMGVDLYGNQQADHYTHVHNYCFHVILCEVFDETPLPVTGPAGFLTEGISFSPFMRNKWPEMGDLKSLNGSNLPFSLPLLQPRHPATPFPQPLLLSVHVPFPQPLVLSAHISFPRTFPLFPPSLQPYSHVKGIPANTNTTPSLLASLPYLGSKKLPKPKSYRSISNQSRQNPFQAQTKDFANASVYFTVLRRPFPIGIHYDQVPDFSQYAEATPSNIQSLVKSVEDFELQQTEADQIRTQFLWLPMVQLDPLLSIMSLDWSTSPSPNFYYTPQSPWPLFFLTQRTPFQTFNATHDYSVVSKISLAPFLCDVPARHIQHLTLTRPPSTNQADTSYQGEAGRWVQVIKHKPHVGNKWSTAPITAAEKAKALFPTTVNEVHQQMNYSKVPTPHGGFATILPCATLYCCGKKPRDAFDDVGPQTVSGVADATGPTSGETNLNTCKNFIGNAYSYKY